MPLSLKNYRKMEYLLNFLRPPPSDPIPEGWRLTELARENHNLPDKFHLTYHPFPESGREEIRMVFNKSRKVKACFYVDYAEKGFTTGVTDKPKQRSRLALLFSFEELEGDKPWDLLETWALASLIAFANSKEKIEKGLPYPLI